MGCSHWRNPPNAKGVGGLPVAFHSVMMERYSLLEVGEVPLFFGKSALVVSADYSVGVHRMVF